MSPLAQTSGLLLLAASSYSAKAFTVDPMCKKLAPGANAEKTPMHSYNVDIDRWDGGEYVTEGTKLTKWVSGAQMEDGAAGHISLHAAHVYAPKDFVAGGDRELPLIAYGSTFTQRIFELSGITFDDLKNDEGDNTTDIDISDFGYTLAPSGLFAIENEEGELQGWVAGGGNPFYNNPDPSGGPDVESRGGVAFMPVEESSACPKLFPPTNAETGEEELSHEGRGTTINTVGCHTETGVCVFSGWKFFAPIAPRGDEDCLWWCLPDDIHNPTECSGAGILTYPDGTNICSEPIEDGTHFGGAVHGFAMGNTDAEDDTKFDLILIFTGGTQIEGPGGVSHMKKVQIQKKPDDATPVTLKSENFGEQLWQDTVEVPYDVGLDHAWVEDGGEYLWISSFRDSNAGVHMMNYQTGELIKSLHGFAEVTPGEHTYPSGIAGYGKHGVENSFIFLVTSNFQGIRPRSPGGIVFAFDIGDIEA